MTTHCLHCKREIKTRRDGTTAMHGQKKAPGQLSRCVPVGAECPGSFLRPAETANGVDEIFLSRKLTALRAAK